MAKTVCEEFDEIEATLNTIRAQYRRNESDALKGELDKIENKKEELRQACAELRNRRNGGSSSTAPESTPKLEWSDKFKVGSWNGTYKVKVQPVSGGAGVSESEQKILKQKAQQASQDLINKAADKLSVDDEFDALEGLDASIDFGRNEGGCRGSGHQALEGDGEAWR
jgi:hypothetical protein